MDKKFYETGIGRLQHGYEKFKNMESECVEKWSKMLQKSLLTPVTEIMTKIHFSQDLNFKLRNYSFIESWE